MPHLQARARRLGCFSSLPKNQRPTVAGYTLDRCPNYYITQVNPEDASWVDAIFSLRRFFVTGNLEQACPNPTLKTIQAIRIVDAEESRTELIRDYEMHGFKVKNKK